MKTAFQSNGGSEVVQQVAATTALVPLFPFGFPKERASRMPKLWAVLLAESAIEIGNYRRSGGFDFGKPKKWSRS
jgi:hypothetical protein